MLVPKKAKELIKPTAEILGYDEQLVERFVNYYWKALRKDITSCNYINIFIRNFGTFSVRTKRVKKLLEKYERQLKSIEPTSFKKCEIIKKIKEDKEKMEKILEVIYGEYTRKKTINAGRHERRIAKANMASSETDTGRTD